MASPFDTFAKEILDVLLHDLGQLETEVEVTALPSQRADVLFVPDPSRDAERRALGLLGRITATAVLLEPFHEAPSVEEVLSCLRKVLNHRHARALSRRPAAERTWLLCAGRPDRALAAFGATPAKGWPRGIYFPCPALPLAFVVLSELDDGDETLPLRLMGAGATLTAALQALRQRYGVLPRGHALFAEVVQVFLAARQRGEGLTEALMVDLSEAYEYMRQQHEEGMREGMREGVRLVLSAIARVAESRLARALTEPEREALALKIQHDGAEAVGDALVSLDRDALARWLGPPALDG